METYEIDELANLVPMASDAELKALMEDIKNNGQQEPALIYKGKIIDGRNRQAVCKELGVELEVETLPDTLSREEVLNKVKSYSTRRSLTDTQKAMSAVNEINTVNEMRKQDSSIKKLTNKKAATKWAVSPRMVERAIYIYKQDKEVAQDLFNGKTVTLYDKERDKDITTSKLTTIEKILKNKNKDIERLSSLFDARNDIDLSNEAMKYDIDFNDYLPDLDVQEYFWDNYKDVQELPILKRDIAILLTKNADLNEELQKSKKPMFKFKITAEDLL